MDTQHEQLAARFWPRVQVMPSGCWEFTGPKDAAGYGRQGARLTHRLAWTLAVGPIPAGAFICHHCDNPPCVNPAHLFVGDHAANMADMRAKGRHPRAGGGPEGERNGQAKLTDVERDELCRRFANGETNRAQLGRDFGVTTPTVEYTLIRRGLLPKWRSHVRN